jgi:hypothetical protein
MEGPISLRGITSKQTLSPHSLLTTAALSLDVVLQIILIIPETPHVEVLSIGPYALLCKGRIDWGDRVRVGSKDFQTLPISLSPYPRLPPPPCRLHTTPLLLSGLTGTYSPSYARWTPCPWSPESYHSTQGAEVLRGPKEITEVDSCAYGVHYQGL